MGWIAKYSSGATLPAFVLQPTISTSSLPSGEVTLAYSFALSAFGGIPPYSWTASGLPAGLACSSNGVVSGTPTASGSFNVTLNLTDSNSTAAPPVTLGLSIATAPVITTSSLPMGAVGTPYSFQLVASGGTPPYTWTETGALQAGLSLSASGLISGTPTAGGTVTPSFTATDSLSVPSAPTGLTLSVSASPVWFGATLPTLPTQFTTTSSPPTPANTNRGSYYTPGVGGDTGLTLQAAINAAAAATGSQGDVIQLLSGSANTQTTASVFTLQPRAGTGTIYIITNTAPEVGGIGLPGAGTRVSPANIPAMASLRTTLANTGGPVINRANGAGVSGYRLVGLDLELTDATAQSGNTQYYVVNFNNGDTSTTTQAQNITLDRCYVSGAPTTGVRHAVGLDGVNMEVTECYIEHCYQFGNADTNAIVAINSTGPYKITNNYLNAQGEITLFGGSDTTLPTPNMPSDITCQRNYYFKQTFTGTGTVTSGSTTLTISTATGGLLLPGMGAAAASAFIPNFDQIVQQLTGTPGGVGTYQLSTAATGSSSGAEAITGYPYGKNSQEFKVGQRVLFDSNYVENAFATVQPRTAFVLTGRNQSGANPWYGLFNFTISNNVFTNCEQGGINVLLQDNNSTASDRILFRNNLFILSKNDNTSSTCSGFVSANSATQGGAGAGSNIIFDHNTFIATAGQSSSMIFCGSGAPVHMNLTNMVWSNNIFDNSNIGLSDAGGGIGYANVVPRQSTPVTWINNVHIGTPDNTLPAGNFHAASQAATGFISYGSNTAAAGYALASSSPYHAVGVSGLNQPAGSAGTADGTDAGCNIANLPTKVFQPPSLLTIAQAGYIIVANAATLANAGIGVGPLSNPANTQTNSYNVDPTGVADSTAGIQHAINDGCLNYQPLYLPHQSTGAQGIYKITNTLEFYTFANQFDTAYSQTSGHHFLGATNLQGQNPVLQASNANGNWTSLLPTSGLARPVVMVTAFSGGTTLPPVSPTNFNMGFDPYTFPSGWSNGTADVVSHSFINVNINTGGLANAGGTSIVGAQTVWVANLTINAAGSVYGIGVLPGNGSVLMNVKITGGQYGINSFMTYALSNWESDDPTVCGLTCTGQTKACVTAGGTASPILIVGGDLEPASGGVAYDPVNPSDSYNPNHSAMFYNVKVVGPGDANSTAFLNAGGYNLYLGDVWVSGFTNVTKFAGLAAQACGGTWTHVTEYVGTSQYKGNTIHTGTANPPWPTFNWVNGTITAGNAGDGTLNNEPATSITTNSIVAPPGNLISRHVVTLPLIDTVPFVDIRNFGAAALSLTGQAEGGPTHNRGTFTFNFSNDSTSTPDNLTPITNAIAAAAAATVPTAVLIPIGVYETSGQIHVPANVQIMGVGADNRSWISTHRNWVPTAAGGANGTPVFTTDSNANSTMAFVNFGINMRRAVGTTYSSGGGTGYNNDFFIPYIWQCGGQCYTFGHQHHYQFITTPVATFALYYRQFQGANAGGRFYGGDTPDSQIGMGANNGARAIYVNGSQQPMYFYSLNLENTKNGGVSMTYNMELTGTAAAPCANVRVYGSKREGFGNTYSITQNCSNVGLFGSSFIRIGSPANATFIGATNNQNILVSQHTAFSDTTSTTTYLLSDAGSGFNLDSPKILSVYKKGSLNDAAMVIGTGVTGVAFNQVFNFQNFAGSPSSISRGGSAGGAQYVNNTISLIPVSGHNVGQVWYSTQVNIQQFTKTFVFSFNSGLATPSSAGISVRIMAGSQQGDANLCGFGYFVAGAPPNPPNGQQIPNMACVKFDLAPAGNAGQATTWVASGQPSSTGFYINGGPQAGEVPQDDLQSAGINFYTGHQFQCTLVYDGTLLTMTLKDLTTLAQVRKSWPVNIPAIVGANTAFVGLAAGQVSNSIPTIYSWSYSTGGGISDAQLSAPAFSVAGGRYASAQTVSLTAPGTTIYYSTNGQPPTTGSTQYTGPITVNASTYLQAIATQIGFTDSSVASTNYVIGAGGTPTVNFPTGFSGASGLISPVGVATLGSNIQLTPVTPENPAVGNNVGCAWYVAPVTVSGNWTCNFTFTFSNQNGGSQGMCFVIQNQPPPLSPPTNLTASWVSGGITTMANPGPGLGYSGSTGGSGQIAGILSSVAIKFDQNAGSSTNLYTNGADVSQNGVSTSPVNLAAGHTYSVALTYTAATTTIAMTLTDTNTSQVYNNSFTVNIPNVVGANTAFVGFTASTGGGAQGAVAITKWTGF